ncbi:MAG: hypothetical protein MZW92_63545 [Comamonadaceae bacterium]|nr:hypothetical protein [Comamonadaceae bacterium]
MTIPEERGSLQALLRADRPAATVTEFNYRIADATRGARLRRPRRSARRDEAERIARATSTRHGFATRRPHRRRTGQGARAPHGRRRTRRWRSDERLFRFEFPERPGALMRFLASMPPDWNITPVPLPQPGRRLRPHPGRACRCRPATRRALRRLPAHAGLPLRRKRRDNPVYRLFLR